jgi:ornithine cyclodeaminase
VKRAPLNNGEVLLLDAAAVRELLPIDECIEVMEKAFRAMAAHGAEMPLRSIVWNPEGSGGLGLMPAFLRSDEDLLGLKAVSFFPGNRGTPWESHQGVVLLFGPEHGEVTAIVDATEITSIRTAAVTGLATRLLAREDASDLAILGSGTQARTHLAAMASVRRLRRVRVWSPDGDQVRAFAERESRRHGIDVEPAPGAREAVAGADLICTVTSAREPVLFGEWLSPGTHVNAVGASVASVRELDAEAVARSRVFGDRRESTLAQAGDFVLARSEGRIGDDHLAGEIGDILSGKVPGRRSPDEITLFKSLGLAIEDLAAARHVARKAEEIGAGSRMHLGGLRHT